MTINDGCDTSTIFEWRRVKVSKLPPGGGRAAAGGTSPARRKLNDNGAAMPRGTKWCAITYLGGPTGKWRAQIGSEVMYGDSQTTVLDMLATLDPRVRGKLQSERDITP